MLENLNMLFLLTIIPCLIFGLVLFLKSISIDAKNLKPVLILALIVGSIVCIYLAAASLSTLKAGNFLAPLGAIFLGIPIGSLYGFGVLILGVIIYSIPKSIIEARRRTKNNQGPKEGNSPEAISFFLSVIFLILAFVQGFCMYESIRLKKKYGDISGGRVPLNEPEIRQAYKNIIFRNHNLLIRGLMFNDRVPPDIILDIYKRMKNRNVEYAVLIHPNTPCSLLNSHYKSIRGKQSGNAWRNYLEKCSDDMSS